jgi:hypothetical protein
LFSMQRIPTITVSVFWHMDKEDKRDS